MSELRRPCDNCPWRIDAPRGYWDPSHFVSIARNCRDDGMHIMGCHKSVNAPEFLPCQGWARVMGFESVGVRIAVAQGSLRLVEVEDRDGPKLFKTFDSMLRANKIKIPPRNVAVPIRRAKR